MNEEASPQRGGGLGEASAGRMKAAALLLAGSVLASRFIGYLREVALAHQVGVGPETDAFYTAFLIPDILNYLLAGGALAIAFIPLYNRVRRREGEEAGEDLFAKVLGTLGVLTAIATVLLWLGADYLVRVGFPDFAPDTQQLTVRLTRIVLPAQIFFLTGGLLRAVLMAHGRFVAQAAAPLIYNGAIIAGGIATGTVEGFAWGVLVGAFVGNWLVPLIEILRFRRLRIRVAPLSPQFAAYIKLALPLMLGISLVTVDEWYEKFFGATLAAGTVAQLSFARKLMMAPVAVVGQAVAAAALPLLSRLYAEGKSDELNDTLLGTLRATVSLAVIASAGCFVFAVPMVDLVYRYGRFDAAAASRVSALLAILCWAVPGWVLQQVAVRAFYAREEMWRPMLLGSGIALAAIPLYMGLAQSFDAEGLAAAGVVAITLNALATLAWSRTRFGGPQWGPVASSFGRAAIVSVAASIAAGLVMTHGPDRIGALRDMAIGGGVFAVVVLLGVLTIGDERTKASVRGLGRRLARITGRPPSSLPPSEPGGGE